MKKKIILIVIVILSLLGLVVAVRHSIISLQMREAQEMVNNTRLAVRRLGGTFTEYIDENGFPAIEYTLETSTAAIRFGGLKADFGLTQDEVWEILVENNAEHPMFNEILNWVLNESHPSPQAEYIISLRKVINNNIAFFKDTFPDDVDWERMGRGGASIFMLPTPAIQEAIRLEAEQRAIDER